MTVPGQPRHYRVVQAPWWRRLVGYCWRSPRLVLVAIAAAVVAAAASVVAPLILRHVVNAAVAGGGGLVLPVIVLVVVGLVSAGLSYVNRYASARIGCDVERFLRTDVFGSMQRLDGVQQDRLETGQVISRASTDVTDVVKLVTAAPAAVASVLQFAAIVVVMLVLSPVLTVVVGVAIGAVYLAARRGSRSFFPATWDVSQRKGEVAAIIEASVTGVRVVKGFGREDDEQRKLEAASTELFASSMRTARLTVVYLPLFRYIPILGQIGVLGVGGYLALHGHLSLGTYVAFSTYLATALGPLADLANEITAAQTAHASTVRIFELVDAEPRIVDSPNAAKLRPGPVAVELDRVTFGYRTGRPVLSDVSLHVAAGETVALVGGTGSGKSTVALLLARFYDPWSGTVHVDGQDLRVVRLDSLRGRTGWVGEDSFLISASIGANIAFGRPDATADRVIAAARAAEAHGFISALPDGYDTVAGERGLGLSGGQRQRIALARALLGHPDVLVLDDATSAVDAGVEAEILVTLRRATEGRTTVLIAHRRSTLDLADRIVVMHLGRVVDSGTHAELIHRCARYRLLLTGVDVETGASTESGDAETADRAGRVVTGELWSRPAPLSETRFSALTAEQAALVLALPPVHDTPGIDISTARRAESGFGLRKLWPVFRRGLLLSTGLVIVEAGLLLAQPWLARIAIDRGVTHPSPSTLGAMCGLGVLAVALIWLATIANLRIVTRNGNRILYWLRIKIFAHLQRLGLDYYEREPVGQIMTRLNSDPEAIRSFISGWVGELVVRGLTLLGVIGLMFVIDHRLALASLAALPFFAAATALYRRISNRAYTEVREREGRMNAFLQERLAGIRITQAYRRETATIAEHQRHATAYRDADLTAKRQLAGFTAFAELCHQAAVIIVICLGAVYVSDGSLSAGGLIAFLLYVGMLFAPIVVLAEVIDGYQLARVGLNRIRDLLTTPTTITESSTPTVLTDIRGDVRLAAVHFRYPSATDRHAEALAGVDLAIPAGETVAVVGSTGAGKSTIVKLVARFYDPTAGAVRIDGHDLRELDLPAFRSRLGFVPQESYLFGATVRDVISYARPHATDHEIEAAAHAVGAHDMIAGLEHGYLQPVGEGGRNLSAGQRQLLALARAELPAPAILLLDEATASLDLATEAAVAAAIRRVASKRTTIVIAHRLTTAAAADRIAVIDHGRLAETGSHEQLLAHGGAYADLWSAYQGAAT